MKVLHILNSDFGSRATMGIRSYHILKNNPDFFVFCRGNVSDIKQNVQSPFWGYRLIGRGIQFLRLLHHSFAKLRKIEKKIFESSAKNLIQKSDVVHLFYHSRFLLDIAKQFNKKVIVEGFTNPKMIEQMEQDGVKLDFEGFKIDKDEMYCYQNCDILISPSAWVTHTFQDLGLKGRLVEIPYGVDAFDIKKSGDSSVVKFCFAGGIKRTKGVVELLEAARELNVDFPNQFELHLYGRVYGELKDLLNQYRDKFIVFHGYENDINKIYGDKDVYVFPTYYEGSSKTVLEAMSFGMPIITTFNSGSPTVNEKNGFIVEMTSASEIFMAMSRFLSSRDLIKKMGEESKLLAEYYSWDLYSKKVNQIYAELK